MHHNSAKIKLLFVPTVIGNGALDIPRGNAFINVLHNSDDDLGNGKDAVVPDELFQPGSGERIDDVVSCSALHHHREDRFVRAEACRRQGGGGFHKRTENPAEDAVVLLR